MYVTFSDFSVGQSFITVLRFDSHTLVSRLTGFCSVRINIRSRPIRVPFYQLSVVNEDAK